MKKLIVHSCVLSAFDVCMIVVIDNSLLVINVVAFIIIGSGIDVVSKVRTI